MPFSMFRYAIEKRTTERRRLFSHGQRIASSQQGHCQLEEQLRFAPGSIPGTLAMIFSSYKSTGRLASPKDAIAKQFPNGLPAPALAIR